MGGEGSKCCKPCNTDGSCDTNESLLPLHLPVAGSCRLPGPCADFVFGGKVVHHHHHHHKLHHNEKVSEDNVNKGEHVNTVSSDADLVHMLSDTVKLVTSGAAGDSSPSSSSSYSNYSCDSPGDELDDFQDRKRLAAVGCRKRKAISFARHDDDDIKSFKHPVYPKSKHVRDKIRSAITTKGNMRIIFGHLGDAQLEDVIDAFQERTVDEGCEIISKGEHDACLYIINQGFVEVVAEKARFSSAGGWQKAGKVCNLGPGEFFGEHDLMHHTTGTTVRVASHQVRLWQLDQEPFEMLRTQHMLTVAEQKEAWLRNVEILKTFSPGEVAKLVDLMQIELFQAGEVIVTQCDLGQNLYVLQDGTAAAYVGENVAREFNGQGDYWGLVGDVVADTPNEEAFIQATGQGATVLLISKDDIVAVVGPLQDMKTCVLASED